MIADRKTCFVLCICSSELCYLEWCHCRSRNCVNEKYCIVSSVVDNATVDGAALGGWRRTNRVLKFVVSRHSTVLWKYALRSGSNVANNYRHPRLSDECSSDRFSKEVIISVQSIEIGCRSALLHAEQNRVT